MGAASVGDLVADLRVGLRHTPIGEIKEVVSNTLLDRLLQSGDIFRQSPNCFDDRPVEGDLMAEKKPTDPVGKPFRESEAFRCTYG